MDMKQALITIIFGMVGTFGFALLFKMRKQLIVWAAIGGGLTCAIYVICAHYISHEFFQNVFPALFATLYSEVLARLTKSPSTQYITCSIIPLVPGSSLYYTMYYFIISDMDNFRKMLTQTARIAAGLAVGIICVSVVIHLINFQKMKHIYDID